VKEELLFLNKQRILFKKGNIMLKDLRNYFDNMPEEELEKLSNDTTEQYEKSWLPENQNSFYACWYCGKDGHAVLCKDGIGRGFCPKHRKRAEKEFMRKYK
jgi:hypothetical protein